MKGICFDEQYSYDTHVAGAQNSVFYRIRKKQRKVHRLTPALWQTTTPRVSSNYADYMIASKIWKSSGWDYKAIVLNLGKDDFYTQVLNAYAEKQAAKTTYTLSAIKLSELSRADVIIDGIIEQINYDLSYVGAAITEGKEFGAKELSLSTNLFDLGLLAEAIGIEYDFQVLHQDKQRTTATGMSIYFPTNAEQRRILEICSNQRYVDFLNSTSIVSRKHRLAL